jgi:hypothetical protein
MKLNAKVVATSILSQRWTKSTEAKPTKDKAFTVAIFGTGIGIRPCNAIGRTGTEAHQVAQHIIDLHNDNLTHE